MDTSTANAPIAVVIDDPALVQGFTAVPNWLLARSDLSVQARWAYVYLLHCAWSSGHAFPSQDTMAQHLGASRHSVMRWLDELKDAGLLRVTKGGRGVTNTYTLTPTAVQVAPSRPCDTPDAPNTSADDVVAMGHHATNGTAAATALDVAPIQHEEDIYTGGWEDPLTGDLPFSSDPDPLEKLKLPGGGPGLDGTYLPHRGDTGPGHPHGDLCWDDGADPAAAGESCPTSDGPTCDDPDPFTLASGFSVSSDSSGPVSWVPAATSGASPWDVGSLASDPLIHGPQAARSARSSRTTAGQGDHTPSADPDPCPSGDFSLRETGLLGGGRNDGLPWRGASSRSQGTTPLPPYEKKSSGPGSSPVGRHMAQDGRKKPAAAGGAPGRPAAGSSPDIDGSSTPSGRGSRRLDLSPVQPGRWGDPALVIEAWREVQRWRSVPRSTYRSLERVTQNAMSGGEARAEELAALIAWWAEDPWVQQRVGNFSLQSVLVDRLPSYRDWLAKGQPPRRFGESREARGKTFDPYDERQKPDYSGFGWGLNARAKLRYLDCEECQHSIVIDGRNTFADIAHAPSCSQRGRAQPDYSTYPAHHSNRQKAGVESQKAVVTV